MLRLITPSTIMNPSDDYPLMDAPVEALAFPNTTTSRYTIASARRKAQYASRLPLLLASLNQFCGRAYCSLWRLKLRQFNLKTVTWELSAVSKPADPAVAWGRTPNCSATHGHQRRGVSAKPFENHRAAVERDCAIASPACVDC